MFSFATKFSPEAANFEKAVFAGYEYAELYLTPTRLMSWRSLSKIARSYDLSYLLHFPVSTKATPQTCQEIVELCQDVSCNIVVVHEAELELAHHVTAIDPTILLAVENQEVRFSDLDDWLKRHEDVSLNLDHLWKETLNNCDFAEFKSVVARLMNNHRGRIRNVHLSGYTPNHPVKCPLSQSPEVACSLLDTILAAGYDGAVVGELDTCFQTGEKLQQDLEWFNGWRARTGLPNLVDSPSAVSPQNQVFGSL